MTTTPTNEAGHGLPELPVPWSDYWASKGNWALSHNYAAFELADEWLRANLDALALSRGVPESGRYFVDGPQGSFFTSDKTFADLFVREVDDPDDWTITDLSNPTGTAPAAAGAQGEGADRCTDPENCRRCSLDTNTPHAGIPRHSDTPQPAAADGGVRERARELLAETLRHDGMPSVADSVMDPDDAHRVNRGSALRAIEAALSSHRQVGEPVAVAKTAAIWLGENEKGERIYATSFKWLKEPQEGGATIHLYTAPPPGPDLSKFRELAAEWNVRHGVTDAYKICADELLALVEKGAGNG